MRKHNIVFKKRRACGDAQMAHYLANSKSFQLAVNHKLRKLMAVL